MFTLSRGYVEQGLATTNIWWVLHILIFPAAQSDQSANLQGGNI